MTKAFVVIRDFITFTENKIRVLGAGKSSVTFIVLLKPVKCYFCASDISLGAGKAN